MKSFHVQNFVPISARNDFFFFFFFSGIFHLFRRHSNHHHEVELLGVQEIKNDVAFLENCSSLWLSLSSEKRGDKKCFENLTTNFKTSLQVLLGRGF